jgi:hypothetical protein
MQNTSNEKDISHATSKGSALFHQENLDILSSQKRGTLPIKAPSSRNHHTVFRTLFPFTPQKTGISYKLKSSRRQAIISPADLSHHWRTVRYTAVQST